MSETAEFSCIRCGKCCRLLVSENRGIMRGLTLLPEETSLFPENTVKPTIGVGETPHDPRFRVLAYQLAVEPCPYLRDTGCLVYDDRPASCRQFPFSLEPTGDGGRLLGVDLNCPVATRLLESHTQISFEGRGAALRLLRVKEQATENPRRTWF